MPPRHGDSPPSHGAFWVAFCNRREDAPCLFVKERVQQRYATGEFRLDVSRRGEARYGRTLNGGIAARIADRGRARYRERDFPDAAQIARFWSGRGFEMSRRESCGQYDEKRDAPAMRAEHF
jgi:hypothetical protein